ncbi:NAD-dependent succinate-semialdehyde dehydrogenase [Burkholderia gladioli]|uniref:NAD-dependent succinate-semialdehyde dehydrogenase n=1 Tax=Burkholderia gladioli TaxID=28095 RepID=UPI000F80E23C|nr:NAD-dependent succinate-semialdehyde dehydrogenase [Burkholderia gladioli]KAF1058584.1 Glutarate-semialdehyde dehydrogenase DavD [Burkholderia gladioli]MBA1360150.1 NAD-dependent succinate-semialdehyde dehydrogenase [Burkholderia gladioli]MDN7604234.1 NAD-dependent succinate-semialdehyde dehydrogenase [Burkholderia gladioli]MDN7810841.1 NAD-dependent succinate-semialdehyde dehydrogenase [Burkholderia gladioli]WAG22757.1 NAD-dependent succinate-semialdehyde dehydrogenase [Burkholderia gladio
MSEFLKTGHYIGGEWHEPRGGEATYAVLNPATGETVAEVARGGAAETRHAIAAAERAWPAWRALTAKERGARVKRWGELMLEHRDALAELLTREQGKPLAEARGEVGYAASFFEWFGEEAKRMYGDVIPSPKPNSQIVVTKEPVGVVAAITPWNFPLAMITRKAGPALAAGCTMVLKPSEETPLSAFALAVLAERAGIPAGVFNIVSGDAVAIGGALTESPVVRKLSFTGSTRVGKLLARQSADTLKKLSLELGGNAPFIVFDDADLDAAVEGAIASKFRNTGQTCVCVNRFLVQDGVYEAFTGKLAEAVRKLRVGDALAGEVDQGPLINAAALDKVERHVADATGHGARVLTGGRRHALGGTFYEPTVLAEVAADALIAGEETFGPVAACFRFSTEEQAIAAANDTPFGLSAYFYTRDLGRAWRVAGALESGMVGVNDGIISTEVAPFGGVKQSGLGREGSKYGIDEYVELKYTLMAGLGR